MAASTNSAAVDILFPTSSEDEVKKRMQRAAQQQLFGTMDRINAGVGMDNGSAFQTLMGGTKK